MKLEVGKFIRTPYGIRKIANITKDDGYGKPKVRVIELDRHLNTPYKFDYIFYTDENVIKKCKTSYNIIDLIEVGDYVNGQKVYYDEELDYLYVQSFDGDGEFYQESIKKQSFINNIETILTKEQFEQMSYKIKE